MWNRDRAERSFFDRPAERARVEPTAANPLPEVAAEPVRTEARPEPSRVEPRRDDRSDGRADARPESSARRPAAPPPQPAPKPSVLGPTLRFKGDLVADEDLVVQGTIEGSILHSRSLTIGPDGSMTGDIRARRIVVDGRVTGDLYALECVTVRATGVVRGSIYAPRVAIAEGAQFDGRVDMANAPAVPNAVVATATAAAGGALPAAPVDAVAVEAELSPQQIDSLLDSTGS